MLMRANCNGVALDLTKESSTVFGQAAERVHLYRPSKVVIPTRAERLGQVKVYTQDEIQEYARRCSCGEEKM